MIDCCSDPVELATNMTGPVDVLADVFELVNGNRQLQ
jgi:hypothetical protein